MDLQKLTADLAAAEDKLRGLADTYGRGTRGRMCSAVATQLMLVRLAVQGLRAVLVEEDA